MSKPMIGVSYPGVSERHIGQIREKAEKYGYDVKFGLDAWEVGPEKGSPKEWYHGCEILFGYPDPAWIKDFKDLKWLQSDADGIEEVLKPGILPENVLFTNGTGAYGKTIAEHTICQLLMLFKRSLQYYENQKIGKWHVEGRVQSIEGAVVAIIGFGDLGSHIAKYLRPFGPAEIRGVKRTLSSKPDFIDALYTTDEMDKAIIDADVVILCLPGIPATNNIFHRERIFSMKKGSYLLNVARSTVWDQNAVIEALQKGHLAGVHTDVAHPEPLPADSPLWSAPNIIITPHSAGGLVSERNIDRCINIFLENLEAYAAGSPMKNIVDRKNKYGCISQPVK